MDASYTVPSKLLNRTSPLQKTSGYLAIIFSFLAFAVTASYVSNSDLKETYLGGLNWGKLIFNWHPVLMVGGLIFCSITSILSYRLIPMTKLATKSLHVFLHTVGVVCFSVGLSAVLIGNNNKSKNDGNTYYSNFNSIHSFLGLAAIILYGQNYVLGFLHYLMPVAVSKRKAYMPSHIFLGSFAFFAAVFAALTGAMELATEYGCHYEVTSPDTNPAEHYHLLTKGCKTLNGIAVLLLFTAFFAAYALWENHAALPKLENDGEKGELFISSPSA
jgi:hypothetical protein